MVVAPISSPEQAWGSHRGQLAVSLDGEVVRSAPPLDYRIRKQALTVIAP